MRPSTQLVKASLPTRLIRPFLAGLLLGGLAVIGSPTPASACSCAFGSDAELVGFADVVFTAELVEIVDSWQFEHNLNTNRNPAGDVPGPPMVEAPMEDAGDVPGPPMVEAPMEDIAVPIGPGFAADKVFVFQVDEVLKGEAFEEQAVITSGDGASCGLEISGAGPFLVFATEDDTSLTGMRADLCGGTRFLDGPPDPEVFDVAAAPIRGSSFEKPGGGDFGFPDGAGDDSGGLGIAVAGGTTAALIAIAGGAFLVIRNKRNDESVADDYDWTGLGD